MWHVHKALNIQDPSDMYQAPYIHGTLNIHKTPAYMGLNPATQRWHSVLRTSCPRRAQQVNWQPGLCSGTLALASLQWHVSWAWSTFHFWTLTQSSPLVLTTPQSMGGHKDRQDIWMLHDHSLKSFHSSCSLSWVCFFLPPWLLRVCWLSLTSGTVVCLCILRVSLHWEEGNGNPLQYSCLENPMDGGAWQATVQRVASWTQLSD